MTAADPTAPVLSERDVLTLIRSLEAHRKKAADDEGRLPELMAAFARFEVLVRHRHTPPGPARAAATTFVDCWHRLFAFNWAMSRAYGVAVGALRARGAPAR